MKPSQNARSRGSSASLSLLAEPLVRAALLEDVGHGGDLTTDAIVEPDATTTARIVARRDGIVAGIEVAPIAFALLDDRVEFSSRADDGDRIAAGECAAEIFGHARAILTGERTALNLLCRLSGIATATRALVDAVAGHAREDRRHAQNNARAARARALRGSLRRRREPSFRARRRRADQRQPHRGRRFDRRCRRRGARRRRPHGEGRSRGRHARAAARGARRARSTPCCSTT